MEGYEGLSSFFFLSIQGHTLNTAICIWHGWTGFSYLFKSVGSCMADFAPFQWLCWKHQWFEGGSSWCKKVAGGTTQATTSAMVSLCHFAPCYHFARSNWQSCPGLSNVPWPTCSVYQKPLCALVEHQELESFNKIAELKRWILQLGTVNSLWYLTK